MPQLFLFKAYLKPSTGDMALPQTLQRSEGAAMLKEKFSTITLNSNAVYEENKLMG